MNPCLKRKIAVVLMMCLGFTSANASLESKVIRAYSSFDVEDFNELNECGDPSGFEVELTNAVFAAEGYAVNWETKQWGDIVKDLAINSADKDYIYVASIEGRQERKKNWLFADAAEFEASHYFFGGQGLKIKTGDVVDTKTGNVIPNFVLDTKENKINNRKLRIATWKGSAFEDELNRVFKNSENIEIIAVNDGTFPRQWLTSGVADIIYVFATGPINSYTKNNLATIGGPITNFDLDRFGGSSPALPMNAFGQDVNRLWLSGFSKIIKDDTFFNISMKWFGRVSWPAQLNSFLINDEAMFASKIAAFEKSWSPSERRSQLCE